MVDRRLPVDGSTTLDNTLTSEFVYGGAFGFEQFYGFGFELSGDAAAALQQSLQPTWIPNDDEYGDGRAEEEDESAADEYDAEAPAEGPAAAATADVDEGVEDDVGGVSDVGDDVGVGRRRRLQGEERSAKRGAGRRQQRQTKREKAKAKAAPRVRGPTGQRRLLSDEEARQRNLPKGAQLIAQVRKPLPKEQTRLQVAEALRRRKQRKRRTLLQEEGVEGGVESGEDLEGGRDGTFTVSTLPEGSIEGSIEEVTGEDIGGITSNWFDSFPAALPTSIRDRLLAQLEEFVLDPQVSISLEIAIAFVGVVEPGVGIVSAGTCTSTQTPPHI